MTTSLISGLGNTLLVDVGIGYGTNMQLKFGPNIGQNTRAFDTDISISGSISAELAGVSIDLVSIEVAGDGFLINVNNEDRYYPAADLTTLVKNLKDAGASDGVAQSLATALAKALNAIGELEDEVQALLNGLQGGGLDSITVPTSINHDGYPEDYLSFETAWELNEPGDRLGSSDPSIYQYMLGDGPVTIHDYSEDSEARDILVFEDVTSDQVEFSRNDDNDLIIHLPNGDTVTINNHFLQPQGSSYEAIELFSFSDNVILTAGEINDLITAGQIILGTPDMDTLDGGVGDDSIDGLGDNDTLNGDAGNDTLDGGTGDDALNGGAGNDTLDGGTGADTLDGGTGTDTADYSSATSGGGIRLNGGTSWGFATGDTLLNIENIVGSDFDDTMVGTVGANTFWGGSGDDTFWAGDGDDLFNVSIGDDVYFGQAGDDTLNGGAGNDTLDSGTGADTLDGGAGNDTLVGGTGADMLSGGNGSDTFDFSFGDGTDVISDFASSSDTVRLTGTDLSFSDLVITDTAGGASVAYGLSDTIHFEGVLAVDLSADNFLFA